MSLVAYGSSDESSEDESTEECPRNEETVKPESSEHRTTKLDLPAPKCIEPKIEEREEVRRKEPEKIHFENLPKPRSVGSIIGEEEVEEEEEVDDLPKKVIEFEKPPKKDRGPVKITVPSLDEFKDVEEESDKKNNRIMPSKKGTGLFALLPPPKGAEVKSNVLVPQVVAKNQTQVQNVKRSQPVKANSTVRNATKAPLKKSLGLSNYDSNSEDEDDTGGKNSGEPIVDFFALTSTDTLPDPIVSDLSSVELKSTVVPVIDTSLKSDNTKDCTTTESDCDNSEKMLVSNVMNLPKEEILMKNKAAVGPKLPVPEQEYNVDQEGNVAFDEKAIEYLCGKRGIKRKNKEIDEANIIEINGEDIKPDEREWLVKALTEEPIQRPVSIGAGVNSQSKKKHQITYLAHQAKAMEMELKNQWAQNRMTRKQTQSKYGF